VGIFASPPISLRLRVFESYFPRSFDLLYGCARAQFDLSKEPLAAQPNHRSFAFSTGFHNYFESHASRKPFPSANLYPTVSNSPRPFESGQGYQRRCNEFKHSYLSSPHPRGRACGASSLLGHFKGGAISSERSSSLHFQAFLRRRSPSDSLPKDSDHVSASTLPETGRESLHHVFVQHRN